MLRFLEILAWRVMLGGNVRCSGIGGRLATRRLMRAVWISRWCKLWRAWLWWFSLEGNVALDKIPEPRAM